MTVAHSGLTGTNLHESKGVAAAAANKVYVTDGAGSGSWTTALLALPAGAVVKSALVAYTTNATLSASIPVDNTIPQNTEGTQIITTSFTPTSATNKLRIRFRGTASTNVSAADSVVALFQDAIAGALVATRTNHANNDNEYPICFEYEMTSGTTSAITFNVRAGSTATMRFNGTTSARVFGGVANATLVIEEIKV